MPTLVDTGEKPATVHAIREVRLGMPLERRGEIQDFYRHLIGLAEWPSARQIPGGWGAGDPRTGAYFAYRHDAEVEPLRRRFIVQVHSLAAVEERLREAGCSYYCEHGLSKSDVRILVSDPVGHLVELRQFKPL